MMPEMRPWERLPELLVQSDVVPCEKTKHDLIEKRHEVLEVMTRSVVLVQSEVVPREETMHDLIEKMHDHEELERRE